MSTFHPTYFSSILQYVAILKSKKVVFEINDNFLKQTYRNRCYVYGANGKQLLNVPIQKMSSRQLTKNVKIDYSTSWQAEHLKTLHAAYSSSPFFEFYIDDLQELFFKKETFLVDLNFKTLDTVFNLLQENISYSKTEFYKKTIENDYRFLVNAKDKITYNLPKYTQVFNEKFGYLSNLSILDLLFMEGPASLVYLEKIDLNLLFS